MAAKIPDFTLNTGAKMPAIAMGCWRGTPGAGHDREMIGSLKHAIEEVGYRHLDTAAMYQNEEEIGTILKESGIPREEFFIVTKLKSQDHHNVEGAINESLKKLQLDYVDCYLMHWPQGMDANGNAYGDEEGDELHPSYNETWRQMEEKVLKAGKAKAIGVSNFSIKHLEKLLATAQVPPAINQVESHPYHPDWKLDAYCKEKAIHITNYSPMGGGNVAISDDRDIRMIAEKHGVAPGQVILSWIVQAQGHSAAPKSANKERMTQNMQLVTLGNDDIKKINMISEKDTKRHTRLCLGPVNKEGLVFGWSTERLGFDVGYKTIGVKGVVE